MKVLVFSYKMRGEPALYDFSFRKYGSLTRDDIFATRREKSPGKSDDVRKFGLIFSGRSSAPL